MIKEVIGGHLSAADIARQEWLRNRVTRDQEVAMRERERELRENGTPENKISAIVNPQKLKRRSGIIDLSG